MIRLTRRFFVHTNSLIRHQRKVDSSAKLFFVLAFSLFQLIWTGSQTFLYAQEWASDEAFAGPPNGGFGSQVAIDGNVAVVGARFYNSSDGSVYVYENQGGTWVEVVELAGSGWVGAGAEYSYSLDIEGDVIAVGSVLGKDVYIWEKPASGWANAGTETRKISSTVAGFGKSISLNGDEILIGSPQDLLVGAAFIYSKANGASWATATQTAKLTYPVSNGDEFGTAVALTDQFAAIGAFTGVDAGNVLIYEKGTGYATTSSADAILKRADRSSSQFFGNTIVAQGDRIVVGSGGASATKAYVYNKPAVGWGPAFTANGTLVEDYSVGAAVMPGDLFGISLAMSGDILAVGAPKSDAGVLADGGAVYLFTLGNSSAVSSGEVISDSPQSNTFFGQSVALYGSMLVAGEPSNTQNGRVGFFTGSYLEEEDLTVCFGASYTFGTQTLTTNGTYMESFVAKNGLDSLVTLNFTVAATQLFGSVSFQDPKCFGSSDGSATFTGSGGTPPYQYSFEGGAFGSINEFTGLADGSYTAIIKDAAGCTISRSVFLFEPTTALNVSATGTDLACYLGGDGTITAAASGGNPGYQYSIDGVNYQSATTITNLDAGTYTVYAKDAGGCVATVSGITLNEPTAISRVVTTTNVLCYGGTNGEINITSVSGGNGAPFEFSKDGVNYQSSGQFTGLSAGVTTIYIKDGTGCVFQEDWTILQPNEIVVTPVASSTTTCGGSDGALEANLSGGVGPFQFSLDGVNFQASNVFNGLSAGNYAIYLKDANDCQVSTVVKVNDPDLFTLATTVINSTCAGSNNGSVNILPDPAGSNYQFSLEGTNFQISSQFENLAPGSYTATVTDDKQCESSIQFLIAEPAQLEVTVATADVSCKDAANGTITITASEGTAPYSYSLDGTNFQAGEVFSSLGSGNYTATVKDANGCIATQTAVIAGPAALLASVVTINATCHGTSTGSASVSVTGGTAPYQFSTDGTNFTAANEFSALAAGTYSFTVKDANGCTVNAETIITEPMALTATVASASPSCAGLADGSIAIEAAGGTAPYTFSINGTDFQDSGSFSGLAAAEYTVTTKDANNCTTSTLVNIAPTDGFSVETSAAGVTCFGAADGIATLLVTGPENATYTYSIDGENFQEAASFNSLAPGDYALTVKNVAGCTVQTALAITSPAALLITLTEENGEVIATVEGGTAPYTYASNGADFQESNIFTLAPGSYTITAKDANGCTTSAEVVISIETGIARELLKQGLIVYPNPASQTIAFHATTIKNVRLFDLSGNEVLTVNNYRTRESIDLSTLVPGVVIVELELSTGERMKQRLIIER